MPFGIGETRTERETREFEHRRAYEEYNAGIARDEALRSCLKALERYGWHDEGCPRHPTWSDEHLATGQVPPCDCGFDRTLQELRKRTIQ